MKNNSARKDRKRASDHHKKQLLRKWALPWYLELILALVLAGAITFLEVWIQPNSLLNTMYDFVHFPIVLVLNVVPAFLMVLMFGAVFGNICAGAAVTDLLLCTLAVANRMKIGYRNEPVWPSDLLLYQEVGDAVTSYHLQFPWLIIAVVVLSAVALALLGLLLRHRKSERYARRRGFGKFLTRLITLLLPAGILTAMIFTVYASDELYTKYARSNVYHLENIYCELGSTYSFLHNITAQTVEKPADYDSTEAQQWDTETTEDASGDQVHVIMVMCEAFSDITDQGIFDYDNAGNPLAHFHALTESDHAISGHLTVSRFGGGTANTEYDVLTGMQASALAQSTSTAFYAVKQNLDSLYRIYNDDGYATEFIHPGYDWFYNRKNVFQYLGAQKSLFYDDLDDKVMKGTWVTDDYLADTLEREFEATVSDGSRMFTYMTTIENHTVYSYEKFGDGYAFPKAETTEPLSDDLQEIADVYVEGIRDTDAMIGRLVEYFSNTDEPVVLAFFGDHLPSLGGNISNYASLGIDISTEQTGTAAYLSSCETPWVIWANDAAADTLDWQNRVESLDLPEDGTISASYLGAVMLELTGRGQSTAWFSWLNQLRRELPVVCGDTIETMDGTITNQLTAEQTSLIDRWHCWSYYKLKEKTVEP